MRQDIITQIGNQKNVTNIVILTHNIDFVFIQSVVIPILNKCGNPSCTIFADALCATESYQAQHLVLDSLGLRFRVVPIFMHPGFCFHPKAILLSGEDKGTLFVGSGNLTFGGWRENGEVWCRFDTDVDGTAPFAAFHDYLDRIINLAMLNESIKEEVAEAFDERTRPWTVDMQAPDGLLGRIGQGQSLLDEIVLKLEGRRVNRITVCSPYFDARGDALRSLQQRVGAPLRLAVQKKRSGMTSNCAQELGSLLSLATVDFFHIPPEGTERKAFIHAKWYAFETDNGVVAFLGSANCSQAALTMHGSVGNAELLCMLEMTQTDFETLIAGELIFLEEDPELGHTRDPEDEPLQSPAHLTCHAARLDQGTLLVAYTASPGMHLTRALLDEEEVNFSFLGKECLLLEPGSRNRNIYLIGTLHGSEIRSNYLWIDHEDELRTGAKRRNILDAVRNHVQKHSWNRDAWNEITSVFINNLEYLPTQTWRPNRADQHSRAHSDKSTTYSAEDVFRSDYNIGPLTMAGGTSSELEDRVGSLRQLLSRWFGLSGPPESEQDLPSVESLENIVPSAQREYQSRNSTSGAAQKTKDSETNRKKTQTLLRELTKAMSSQGYIQHRTARMLGLDLQFGAILLRVALREEWISEQEFFEVTHQIWGPLFFYCDKENPRGWLSTRLETDDDKNSFINSLVSSRLAAALASWAFAIPETPQSPQHARFKVAHMVAVSRFPWLWDAQQDELVSELSKIYQASAHKNEIEHLDTVASRWGRMMYLGTAVRRLESALEGLTPDLLKDKIKQINVKNGDILWQGSKSFAIAAESFVRSSQNIRHVLFLQDDEEKRIRTDYAIPLLSLIEEQFVELDEVRASILKDIIEVIRDASLPELQDN